MSEIVQWIQAIFMVGMLVMGGVMLNKFTDMKARLEALWKTDSNLLEEVSKTYCRVDNVHSILNTKPAGRYTVLVVGQHKDMTPFAWGVTGVIEYGREIQNQIPIQSMLRKGAVVICIGDAELVSVLCGIKECSPWLGGGSPMCFTQEDLQMGVQLSVRVRSTKL